MKKIIRLPTRLKNSPIHGYGVFAKTRIRKNQTIEECPVIVTTEYYPEIENYAFDWKDDKYAIALGNGCFYNHSETPNAGYFFDHEKKLIRFFAKQAIYPGEEILIYYGKNWFEERKVKLIVAKRKYSFYRILYYMVTTIACISLVGLIFIPVFK